MNTTETMIIDATIDTGTAGPETALPHCPTSDPATPGPGNDNATRGGIPDTTPLAAHAEVVQYVRATLRRYGVLPEGMADAIAEVQTRSIEAARTGRMPVDLAQWKALAVTIAVRWAVDGLRDDAVRDKYDAGRCVDAGEYARPTLHWEERDPVDTKRYLAILKELFDSGQMPEDGAEILWGEAEQVPHAEIAAELGVTENAVCKRLSRMRAKFRARLAALGMLTLLLLLWTALLAPLSVETAPAPHAPPQPTPPARCLPGWDGGTCPSEKSSFPAAGNRAVHD